MDQNKLNLNKKTVWIVNEYNFPDDKNTRQTNLCRLLNENGYDCYIISGSAQHKGEENRLHSGEKYRFVKTREAKGFIIKTGDYNRTYERVLVSIQFQSRVWSIRRKLPKPDVIISEFAGLFGNVFLRWKKRYGVKIIFDILDPWPEDFVDMGYIRRNSLIAKWLYALEHKSYREADGIIFSYQGGRDYIIDKGWSREIGGDIDTSDIGYLNNGVNLKVIDTQKRKYILNDPDLDRDWFKFIYLGSISEFNGLDILVETALILQKRKDTKIMILVYGYGNQEENLRSLVRKYKLRNIKFKGKLDKKYAMNVLSRGDVNLFTFRNVPALKYGVSPNKLFMYFASGKPVLSMIKPKYDLVSSERAGISVNNDPMVIADAMQDFSKMKNEEYSTYCKNARKTAEKYDYEKLIHVLIKKIEKAYE